jgi:uncharacterized protein
VVELVETTVSKPSPVRLDEVNEGPLDQLFVEPGLEWRQVSPKLLTERRLPLLGVALVGLGLIAAAVLLNHEPAVRMVMIAIGLALLLAAGVGWCVVVPRMVRSWRYAERAEDLLVSRGRLIRRLTVVPYGRMQVIEVSAGPVSARLGIATVTLVTASASTDAKIPGVPVAVAHELRDRLAAKGEALTAGL